MKEPVYKIILTGLMMAMITVSTMMIAIPVPVANGYIHLGDSMVFLSVLLLGKRLGTVAAGVGSCFADLILGFANWAPWSLVIKGLMAFIMGYAIEKWNKKNLQKEKTDFFSKKLIPLRYIMGMTLAGLVMITGYFIAGGIMFGSFIVAAFGIPANILQFVVGLFIASLVSTALSKTPAGKYFALKL